MSNLWMKIIFRYNNHLNWSFYIHCYNQWDLHQEEIAESAGAVEYTDSTSAEV